MVRFVLVLNTCWILSNLHIHSFYHSNHSPCLWTTIIHMKNIFYCLSEFHCTNMEQWNCNLNSSVVVICHLSAKEGNFVNSSVDCLQVSTEKKEHYYSNSSVVCLQIKNIVIVIALSYVCHKCRKKTIILIVLLYVCS